MAANSSTSRATWIEVVAPPPCATPPPSARAPTKRQCQTWSAHASESLSAALLLRASGSVSGLLFWPWLVLQLLVQVSSSNRLLLELSAIRGSKALRPRLIAAQDCPVNQVLYTSPCIETTLHQRRSRLALELRVQPKPACSSSIISPCLGCPAGLNRAPAVLTAAGNRISLLSSSMTTKSCFESFRALMQRCARHAASRSQHVAPAVAACACAPSGMKHACPHTVLASRGAGG
eukprot:1105617-Pleurochrysis_carterae.AAC.4